MRAIAAVGVFFFHALWRTPALQPLAPVLAHGDIGVELFFIMSGFLVARPLVAHAVLGARPVPFGGFWLRRVARIWPAYLVALGGALALGVGHIEGWGGWVKHGLLIDSWFEDRGGTGLRPSWTLVVEVAFYAAVLPLAALVALARRRSHDAWVTLCFGLFAFGSVAVVQTSYGETANQLRVLAPFLTSFAAGMLLAGAEVGPAPGTWCAPILRGVRWLASRPALCGGLAAALFVAMTVLLPASSSAPPFGFGFERTAQSFVQVAVGFLALAPLALRTTRASWLEHPVLLAVGAASFGFYLWHIQVLYLARPLLQGSALAAGAGLAIALVGAYLAGAGSRRLIEEPARKALPRLLKRNSSS